MSELPDFHIPHAEKIAWMIDEHGWAMEPVAPTPDTSPPEPGYAYTIGFPERFGFADVVVFGLQPVAAHGLFELVAGLLSDGVEVPVGVAVTGLFDNDLRCVFAPVDIATWGHLFGTLLAWRRGAPGDVVQLLWPDRNGFLPSEAGFDRRLTLAQPVIGAVS